MSIGNLKDSGNQGNNMPWQWQVLKGLQAILDEVAEPLTCLEDSVTICSPTGGLDVNVHDALGNNITSTTIGADTGLDVNIIGGVPLDVTITGPLGGQDCDDSLAVSLCSAQAQNLLDIKDAVEGTLTVGGTVTANAGTGNFTVVQPTASNLNATVVGGTGVSRTPNFLRPSTASPGTGIVNTGAFSASFASVGTANALVGGMVLKPGETLNFDAGAINNTLAAITYNVTTTGAELIIITLT